MSTTSTPKINPRQITLGELRFFERETGTSIASLGDKEALMGGPLTALCAIALRRSGLYATSSDAITAAEALTIEEAMDMVDLGEDQEADTAGE